MTPLRLHHRLKIAQQTGKQGVGQQRPKTRSGSLRDHRDRPLVLRSTGHEKLVEPARRREHAADQGACVPDVTP